MPLDADETVLAALAFLETIPHAARADVLAMDTREVLLGHARSRAPVLFALDPAHAAGLDQAQRELFDLAVAAAARVTKTAGDTVLSDAEAAALRAFVAVYARPSLLVRHDVFVGETTLWGALGAHRAEAADPARGVGRLDRVDAFGVRAHQGSGFLVAPGVVLTNNHVVMALAGYDPHAVLADPTFQRWTDARYADMVAELNDHCDLRPGERPAFDLKCESGLPDVRAARVRQVLAVDPTYDAALLELEETPPGARVPGLSAPPVPDLLGKPFYALGYPALGSPGRPALDLVLDVLFRPDQPAATPDTSTPGSVKRLAPGRFLDAGRPGELTHDATTLGGSSGSALVDVSSHRVVALHCSGAWFRANRAVALAALKDGLLAGLGVAWG